MTRCLIALGGNVGDSRAISEWVREELKNSGIAVTGHSPLIVTRPVGPQAGESFWNAAATLEYNHTADQLLQLLHRIEAKAGRTRTIHWGPRTLDLDLCLFGDEVIQTSHLVVPHPAMWYRRFVLDPASEVAAEMRHPILQQTVQELWACLHRRPLRIELQNVNPGDATPGDEIFRMPEILSALTGANEPVQWCLQEDSRQHTEPLFATVVFEKTPDHFQLSQQPQNSFGRIIRIYADNQDHALSQLPSLRAAILG